MTNENRKVTTPKACNTINVREKNNNSSVYHKTPLDKLVKGIHPVKKLTVSNINAFYSTISLKKKVNPQKLVIYCVGD